MQKLAIILTSLLLLTCCSTVRYIPSTEQTVIRQIDSIAWHDSTVYHHIYKEHYKDYAGPKDTLNLETAYSKFKAWNDSTSNTIKGEAVNKVDSIPVKTKWKEKLVYRDSLVYVDKPYPVEVIKEERYIPTFFWITFGWFIISILYIIIRVFIKFKR